ncbi:hypothetical protein [Deinococcus kurensis]|uniref:hypothetical protein n=1 Tax=Deinococcus kurensis TaxID=2662757 RepID=UPI0012D33EFC|nr:hypothetical protein [Deinococcus kurensis]
MSRDRIAYAATNPHDVQVGQIWEDTDPRGYGPHIQVYALNGAYAECYQVSRGTSQLAAGEDKRYRNGKPRRIRLDRFKPGSTGYKLVGGEAQ